MTGVRRGVSGVTGVAAILWIILSCAAQRPGFEYQSLDTLYGKNVVVDVDMDGINDIVTVHTGEAGGLVWYKFHSNGTSEKHVALENVYFRGDRIDAGDIDNDGDVDIAAGFRKDGILYAVWLRNPLPAGNPAETGSWEMIQVGRQGPAENVDLSYVKDMALADFDGDGRVDIVTRTHHWSRIFFQNSPTDWVKGFEIEHESHEGMDVGDLDADGDPDIVLNGFWYETPAAPRNGEFTRHEIDDQWYTQTEGTWRDNNAVVKVADLTGDGLDDVFISHSEKPGFPIMLYTAESGADAKSGSWISREIAPVFDFCQTLDAGDIDNDGDLDVLAAKFERDHGSEEFRNYPPFPVTVYYNVDGKGMDWERTEISEKGMYDGMLGDVGSDGNVDILGPRSYWKGPTDLYVNQRK